MRWFLVLLVPLLGGCTYHAGDYWGGGELSLSFTTVDGVGAELDATVPGLTEDELPEALGLCTDRGTGVWYGVRDELARLDACGTATLTDMQGLVTDPPEEVWFQIYGRQSDGSDIMSMAVELRRVVDGEPATALMLVARLDKEDQPSIPRPALSGSAAGTPTWDEAVEAVGGWVAVEWVLDPDVTWEDHRDVEPGSPSSGSW